MDGSKAGPTRGGVAKLERRVQMTIALLVPAFAIAGVSSALSVEGPDSPTRLWIASGIFLSTVPVGLLMTRLQPQRVWWRGADAGVNAASWFICYADLGVAGVLFTYADHELGMYGTALFAVIGAYAGHFAGSRTVLCHIVFTSVVIVVLSVLAWLQGGHDAAGIVTRCLASLLAANASVLLIYEFAADIRTSLRTQLAHATRDPLTGLWNRRGLDKCIARMVGTNPAVGFVVVDIDDFKSVNDAHGHAAGDVVLIRLAERLRDLVQDWADVARTGGEEFVVVARRDLSELEALAEQIRNAAHNRADDVPVTVSIGVAGYPHGIPETSRSQSAQEVIVSGMEAADLAMYEAKAFGGNKVIARKLVGGRL